jgi:hypothetical protein
MPVGDALHDGESEAASGNIELVSAKESVKDAFAISDRDTRPGIMDREYRMMIRVRYGDINPPASRRIADGVIDQVANMTRKASESP